MLSQERLHIGRLIKDVFDKSGLTISEFARLIHCTHSNVYSIFERYDIGVEQLVDISIALQHNFLNDVQYQYDLKFQQLPQKLVFNFNLDKLTPEKIQTIVSLLMELKGACE